MTIWSSDFATSSDKLKPISTTTIPMATKLGRVVTYTWRAPNNKVTQFSDHVVLQSHVTSKYHYISATRVPMATKLDRMVTHFARLLTVKAFYGFITWSRKVTWQTKIIIYLQPECLWLQTRQNDKLPGWVPTYSHTNFWSRDLARSRDKLKPLYLPYQCLWLTNLLGWWYTLTGS